MLKIMLETSSQQTVNTMLSRQLAQVGKHKMTVHR